MSDTLAIAYFAFLAGLALIRPLPSRRRVVVLVLAAMMSAAILGLSRTTSAWRDWFPLLTILAAYYLSGVFVVQPSRSVEAWLMGWDRRLLGDPTRAFERWPGWALAALEVLYLNTFLTVPAGFAVLWVAGEAHLADRYWTIVMGALLICYAGTAVIHTRPPRRLEQEGERAGRPMRRVALRAVDTFTIGTNTIPSGHVAAPLAIALALMSPLPWAGAIFLLLTVGITLACIAGRYHFVIDCALGVIAAIAVWLMLVATF